MNKFFILLFTAVIVLLFTSCSAIRNFYICDDYENYAVHRAALLPMLYDDSSDVGTYYSTNHFFNKILDDVEDIELTDIDTIRTKDYEKVLEIVNASPNKGHIDLKNLFETSAGKYLKEEGCQVIIAGAVDTIWVKELPFSQGADEWASTHCIFHYSIISLENGKVLWKIKLEGSKAFITPIDDVFLPPLDMAISSGIDNFFDKFPFKKKNLGM